MAKIMELLDYEFSINMLRTLVEKLDNMQEYVDNGSRDQKSKRESQGSGSNQNVIKEMKDAFNGPSV